MKTQQKTKIEWKKVKDFAEVITGGTPSTTKNEYWDNGNIPWLPSGKCQDCEIKSAEKFITEDGLRNSAARIMPIDTVVIALTGATTGKTGILKIEASANQSVTGILPSEEHDPKYLFYYLRTIRKRILDESYGGAQSHISQGYVKNLDVPLPDLETQKQIVAVLEKAEALKQKQKKVLELYDEYLKSVFWEMFLKEKGKFDNDILNNVVSPKKNSLKRGPFGGSLKKEIFVPKGYKVYEQQNAIYDNWDRGNYYIDPEKFEEMKDFSVKPGDIIISCSGTIGKLSILPPDCPEGIINQALLKISLDNHKIIPIFFKYLFESFHIQNKLFGFSRGSGIQNFPPMNNLRNLKIPLPPLPLQQKFASIVEKVEKLKEKQKKSLEDSEELFNALMQRAFRGELG